MSDDYQCPICGKLGERSPRYPRYICVECGHRATDRDGRPLWFTNVSVSGGFEAYFRDSNEPYTSHICYVDDVKCWADEAHMGGIVVSLYEGTNWKE
jgi:hypothetical protein